MAEEKRYVGYDEAKYLWDKAAERYVRKDGDKVLSDNNYTTAEKEKLEELENYELPAASDNTLGGVKIGTGLAIDEEGVVSVESAGAVEWDDVQDTPNTLEGYGITDAATKAELEEVKEEVSKAYHFKGSVNTFNDLQNVEDPHEGDVWNVKDTGKNYAWAIESGVGFWDDIGGIFEIETLTQHDLDEITGSTSDPETMKDLIAEGGEIELDANMSFSEPLSVTKDTVIDLAGNSIQFQYANDGYLFNANGAKLTIKGGQITTNKRVAQAINGGEVKIESGTYASGNVAFSASGEGSKVIFNGGSVTAQEGGIGAFDKAEVEINGGSITGVDNFPVFTNGTAGLGGNKITINGGDFEGNITSAGYESCCLYVANNDTVVINGGRFVSTDGCGILMRAGNVTINDCEIIAGKKDSDSHSPGWVGDMKGEAGKMSASAVIYHESANYPGKAGMSLEINGGRFVGADHALEILSNEAAPNVTVNGGEFVPDFPE